MNSGSEPVETLGFSARPGQNPWRRLSSRGCESSAARPGNASKSSSTPTEGCAATVRRRTRRSLAWSTSGTACNTSERAWHPSGIGSAESGTDSSKSWRRPSARGSARRPRSRRASRNRLPGNLAGRVGPSTGRSAAAQLGPDASALATLLNTQMGLSLGKPAAVLQQTFGLRVTPGGVSPAVARVGRQCTPTYAALTQRVGASASVTIDDTGWRVGGVPPGGLPPPRRPRRCSRVRPAAAPPTPRRC